MLIDNNTSANKRIAKNSIYMSIRMVVVLLISLYTTRVVLRVLGVQDYGIYNVVAGFVSMFVFLNTSMSNAAQRFFNYELGKNGIEGAQNVYNTSLKIQLILAILVLLATESIGLWYLRHKMVIPEGRLFAAEWVFHLSVCAMFLTIMNVPYMAAVMAHERMDFFSILGVLDVVFKLLIVVLLPFLPGDKLILYGILYLLINVLNLLCYFIYTKKNFAEIRITQTKQKGLFKSMLSFSGWNFFGSFSSIMKEQGLNLILNLFFGPIVNAARGIANQINGALQGFVSNITIPVRPQVVQTYAAGNYIRTMSLTYTVSKLSVFFLFVISLPIIYEIDFILKLWLGDNVPKHTNTFAIIVILISFVNNLNAAISGVIHASGKMMKYQVVSSSISLLCLPAAYLALKLGFSPEFAMLMVLLFASLSQIASVKILQEIVFFPIRDYLSKVINPVLRMVLLSVLIPYLPHFILDEGIHRFILTLLLGLSTTSAIGYYVCLNKSERLILSKFVVELINKTKKV